MKKIIPEFHFSSEEQEQVRSFAAKLNLSETTAGILFARGVDTEEKMRAFLHPTAKNFLSPFLMHGMEEAKALITRARDEEWRVAVFGDYDADGIGALAILSRALKEFGIEPYLHVPERTDGYGLNVSAIDRIFDEFLPDLFITVDCGISCAEEVEYIKEQGAYVIVTDHHELPAKLPDCIVVNPKLKDDYPYDNLAGAGVAFKLATALIGEKANALLDFCALSTVADSVPLLGENRDIVSEGVKLIEKDPRPAFSALIGNGGEVNAQTLAFTVAPRLNAAGRMGDAASALRLFTSDDEEEIYALASKLTAYNTERQKYCEELHAEADAIVRKKGAFKHIVMACGEHWNAGFVGIVAARLAEEYARPCLLFVKNGNMYRGSARSVESVNIFEALSACSEYIEEFGGHAQAAGVNVREENFPLLEEALDNFLSSRYTQEDFVPKVPVVGELKDDFMKVAKELDKLEPFGVGNRRPLFLYRAEEMTATPLKAQSPHLTVSDRKMEFTYFNGLKHKQLLESGIGKDIVYELNLSRFRGKERARGYIRAIAYDSRDSAAADGEIFENNLLALSRRSVNTQTPTFLSEEETHALIGDLLKKSAYGACFIAHKRETVNAFPELQLVGELFRPMSGGCQNTLLFSPAEDADLAGYSQIVYLDEPRFFPATGNGQKIYCNRNRNGYAEMKRLKADRESLSGIFVAVRANAYAVRGETPLKAAQSCNALGFDREEFMFALSVFAELGLLKLTKEGVFIQKGVKRELTDSAIFGAVLGITEA